MLFNTYKKRTGLFNNSSGQVLIELTIVLSILVFLVLEIQFLSKRSKQNRIRNEVIYDSKN